MNLKNINRFKIKKKLFYTCLNHLRSYPNKHHSVTPSELTLDIVMPTTDKDIVTLGHSIKGIKRYLKHPIDQIYLVAPDSKIIRQVCADFSCTFIDESTVLPLKIEEINYHVDGVNRNGWMFQQFLGWSGGEFCKQRYYLVLDSDTVYVRPQVFEKKGQFVFNCSDEHHRPYFDVYERLTGEKPPFPFSFTSHQMLYDTQVLAELKTLLEDRHGKPWYQAILETIDKTQMSAHSDYETYGQYYFSRYRKNVILEYWFNHSLPREDIENYDFNQADPRFKSISFHSWKKRKD